MGAPFKAASAVVQQPAGVGARTLIRIALAGLALGAAWLVLAATHWGIGASPDSAVYLGAAQNLLAGRGLTVPFGGAIDGPLVQFPPLYPLALAVVGFAGPHAARWLAAALFAANVVLVGALAGCFKTRSQWVSVVAAGLLLVSPSMAALHAMAWSEPLFLCLGFAGLLALVRYFEQQQRLGLWVSAVLLGLAALTRFAGLAFVLAAGLALCVWAPGRPWPRLRRAAGWGAAAGLPLAAWMLYNQAVAGTATNRALVLHPLQLAHARQALDTLASWLLLPAAAPSVVKLVVPLVVLGGLAAGWVVQSRHSRGASPVTAVPLPLMARVLLLFCLVYGLFLALSISFIDANTPLDDRILAPVYLAGLVVVVGLVGQQWPGRARWLWWGLVVATVVFGAGAARQTALLTNVSYQQGLGFNHAVWRASPLLALVRGLPAATVLYSNAPEAVYLHTGRSALRLPRPFNAVEQTVNADYAAEVAGLAHAVEAGGVVVHFAAVRGQSAAQDAALIEALDLHASTVLDDGLLYRHGN